MDSPVIALLQVDRVIETEGLQVILESGESELAPSPKLYVLPAVRPARQNR